MKTKKRTPKPVTLLTKVEMLLSDVLQGCSEIEKSVEKDVRMLLRSAEASVSAAKDYFVAPEPSKTRRKTARTSRRLTRQGTRAATPPKRRSAYVARKVA